MISRLRRLSVAFLIGLAASIPVEAAFASQPTPAQTAESIRSALVDAQLTLTSDPVAALTEVQQAEANYQSQFETTLSVSAPEANERVVDGFSTLKASVEATDSATFAAARAQVWTSILAGGYATVEGSLNADDAQTAQTWLPVREFRTATRFSRPNADATLAIDGFANDTVSREDAILALHADLLDTYQARLTESLRTLATADANGFASRRAELAALAEGYFFILAPAYAEQRGAQAATEAQTAFAELRDASITNPQLLAEKSEAVDGLLTNFRAAPLSPAEQSRRAGQLLRFLSLVPVEYGRGVVDGRVTRGLEIQEAITFHQGAYAAFADLQDLLNARDSAKTSEAEALFDTLGQQLADAGTSASVASPEEIQTSTNNLNALLTATMPETWLKGSTQGDFDVIASMLDQMENAVRNGDYEAAESARLEAYAVMETGPEARLMVFAPQLKLTLEELFWNGQGEHKGLAHLISNGAPINEIRASRAQLDSALTEAQTTLGSSSAPTAIATNAGVIVFREGLEAVIILASLMSSMKRAEERKYRKPMWFGTAAALVATLLTWFLARGVLQSLARYGEKLEAVVSLIAIGVLLLITNWFFHKMYWTEWLATFHAQKRRLISGEAGLWLGLVTLGFTSVYREGFETVLFLQALVLEAGTGTVMLGVVIALLAVVAVGLVTFRLQVNLPYKKMLIITGIMIGAVLLQMVGTTAHIMQVVGWLPIHVIEVLPLPYWLGTWFGLYATWEGIGLQVVAAAFVIGSYYLAEYTQKREAHVEKKDNSQALAEAS